jgi:hypothetical protein
MTRSMAHGRSNGSEPHRGPKRVSRPALAMGVALAVLAGGGRPALAAAPEGAPGVGRPAGIATHASSPPVQLPPQSSAGKEGASAPSPQPAAGTSSCSAPTLTQPFLSVNDTHWYTLMAGQTADHFDGTGWQLSHGAAVVTAKLADGSTGTVLDLPAGAQAVSPTICVASDYPLARTMVRNVRGRGGITFYMALNGTRKWTSPQSSGKRHGKQGAWSLTNRINLHPPHTSGWHLMRIKLVGRGTNAEEQLYNFYVDPRMKW